jgi:hypothetical protein
MDWIAGNSLYRSSPYILDIFFISLYTNIYRKRMDAQHCGVLVKTYNIIKMQKLMLIKTQSIF